MTRRIVALTLLLWAFGFVLFAITLPRAAGSERTDAVVVLTGSSGRIARGLETLNRGWAPRMFVSGVAREVKPHEFALEYKVGAATMSCCVTLGFDATDTVSNAHEVSAWVAARHVRSLRLVTSDWHMRRAALELRRRLPAGTVVVEDAVQTHPPFRMLFLEYHKFLARLVLGAIGA